MSKRRAIAAGAAGIGAALVAAAPASADVATIREATAANAAGIQPTVSAFQGDLGDPNNGNTVGTQPSGRRQITWDGADADSAPARLPADFFNSIAPRGAILRAEDPRAQFQQSADGFGNNPTNTLEEFGNLNATYPTAFATFSAPRLFSSLITNVYEVEFFVPGTLTRAQTTGFGAVFTDVDGAGSSKLEFFDRFGTEILERQVLPTAGDASLSFLGVEFTAPDVARVRVTSGAAPLGPNDITQGGAADIVVVDDFIYGEPGAQPLPAVSFSSTEFAGAEGTAATVSIERSGDTQATVKAGVSLSDGTARAGSDYEPTGGTVTFAPGETQKSITVPLAGDDAVEETETVNLTLDPATSNGMLVPTIGPNSTATLSIQNVPPANDFSFGQVKKNKKKGTAKLTVEIAEGPGDLELAKTKKVKSDDEAVEADGTTAEKLKIKPTPEAKTKLRRTGKANVKAEVTYTPTGGSSNTQSKKIKLLKR